jgi:IclR family transcriptional regulator, blcABC operon repressor
MSTKKNFCDAAKSNPDSPVLPKGGVPAVLKAVQIMDALAKAGAALSLANLTKQLGLPKSSLLSLCNSLCETGLTHRTEHGTYELGNRVLEFANAYLRTTDITKEFVNALDEMRELRELREEGVVLAVLDGTDAVYVACRNGTQPLGVTYRIGMRLPAACTATGKAILSTIPENQLKHLYRGVTLHALTPHSHTRLKSLADDLAGIRLRGYALDNEETREGMYCIGAPVFNAGSQAIAAVAVSMLKAKGESMRGQMTEAVQELAAILSRRMGDSSRR